MLSLERKGTKKREKEGEKRKIDLLESSKVESGAAAFLPQTVLVWLADCSVSGVIEIELDQIELRFIYL